MDVREAGRRGGEATKKKYGPEHYKKLVKLSNKKQGKGRKTKKHTR